MNNSNIILSIICNTYNHEKYIRACLDGFIMQKTDFAFEILIHDDASTDGTVEIIKEYEKKYPNIIKPIYQKENQYSQNIRISDVYQYPRAQGKYFAICEGDDLWTDRNKLQLQVEYLNSNDEYAICVHQASRFDCNKKTICLVTNENNDRDYTAEEIIKSGGAIFATNSIVARKEVFLTMPNCFKAKGFSDYQVFVYGAILGKLHYLNKNMSTYNVGTEGSFTQRIERNKKRYILHLNEMIRMLKSVDSYYNQRYHNPITYKINHTEYRILLLQGNIIKIHRKKYRTFYESDRKKGYSPDKECIAALLHYN